MRLRVNNNISLAGYQKDFLYCKKRFTVVEASTKTGKTHTHLFWIFEMAHGGNPQWWTKSVQAGWEFWWVAPVYSQAKIAFKRLKQKLRGATGYTINKSELTITTPIGSVIAFKTAKDPDNLFGENVYGAVFDEFTRSSEDAWFALRSTLTNTKAPCKFIGNYKGKSNWGHKLGQKALDKNSEYAYFKVTAYDAVDAGILDAEEVEQARKDLPKKVFEALYLAKGDVEDGLLFDIEDISNAYTNDFIEPGKKRYLTCDIAAYGSDRFVINYWEGWVSKKRYIFDKIEPDEVVVKIKEIAKLHSVPRSQITYDADGLGTYLRGYLKNAVPFINGSKPIETKEVVETSGFKAENYQHLKAQCWFLLAKKFRDAEIKIEGEDDREATEGELEVMRRVVKEEKLNVISKEQIKKIIGKSSDVGDTYMMRVIFDLKKKKSRYGYA